MVIIGSGITGFSVARTLLASDPNLRVTVLEARTICSGATGRNGGHLVSYGGANYNELKQTYGKAEATKIIEFTFKSVRRTKDVIEGLGNAADGSEFRPVTRIRTFGDHQSFNEARQSIDEFVLDNPQYHNLYTIIDDRETLHEKYNVYGVVGAVVFEAAALWPYRLIMAGWKDLLRRFSTNLTLEAKTPVSAVNYRPVENGIAPYVVTTTRGEIQAGQVVYCTNGYTGNLIPGLRGGLFPYRGTMTVQDLNDEANIPNRGAERSWSIHQEPKQEGDNSDIISSVQYLQQNANSGHYFFGGGKYDPIQAITGDDAIIPESGVQYLQAKLSSFLGQESSVNNKLISSWTGIMGFTSDGNPLVGHLPPSITCREGNGEWIAAGFNGMGMSLCVASGEALAYLMQSRDVSDWLPEVFKISESRLQSTLNTEQSIEDVKHMYGIKSS